MFGGTSLLLAGAVFIGSAGAVWLAGIWLSDTTDALERRFGFGQAIGGLVILAITTNMPEIASTTGAAGSGDPGSANANASRPMPVRDTVLARQEATPL